MQLFLCVPFLKCQKKSEINYLFSLIFLVQAQIQDCRKSVHIQLYYQCFSVNICKIEIRTNVNLIIYIVMFNIASFAMQKSLPIS